MALLSTCKVSVFEQHKSWGVDLRAILCVYEKLAKSPPCRSYIGVCINYDYLTFSCL